MKNKALLFLIIILIIQFSLKSSLNLSKDNLKKESSIGWLHRNCFGIQNQNLTKGSLIIIIIPDSTQEIFISRILRKARKIDDCPSLSENNKRLNLYTGTSFYKLPSLKHIEFGIGIISDYRNNIPLDELLDINGDGIKDTFYQCTTSEGIQFSIWDGKAYKSNLIWSGYYYLGYDTEPNCPELPNK